MRRESSVALLCCLLLMLLAGRSPVHAYESSTTHPGMCGQAVLRSALHRHLRARGFPLGVFTRLALQPRLDDPRLLRRLRLDLRHISAQSGYRPGPRLDQWAIGWVMAGSVVQGMPAASDRNHFYCPAMRRGLDDKAPLLGFFFGLMSTIEGGDSMRALLTGTNFDLTGTSALRWIHSRFNPHSVERFYRHLARSVKQKTPAGRRHALAHAMLALGGLLHVLQDLGSPTHVRNDYRRGQLQKLSNSTLNRGSLYERYVARAYGRAGLPRYRGRRIVRSRIEHYFSSPRWNGLADLTHAAHFSPGTLPPSVQLRSNAKAGELKRRLARKLPFQAPPLGQLDLACARRETCHQTGPHGARLAYRVDHRGTLRFFLDGRCIVASARHLVPLTVGFSIGLIDHLLRGAVRLALRRRGGALTALARNGGPALRRARAHWIVDRRGVRRVIAVSEVKKRVARGAVLASRQVKLAKGERLLLLLEGRDGAGDPLVAVSASRSP